MGKIGVKITGCLLVVFFMLAVTATDQATAYLLSDLNSTVAIDPDSSDGVWNWTVDGSDHMFQQWFWYRIGAVGPEMSIDTLTTPLVSVTNADFDPGDETINIRYDDSRLRIDVSFQLTGGVIGSGASDMAEVITITNLTDDFVLDFNFFQYVDFNLNDTIDGDTAWIATGGGASAAWQTGGGGWVSETTVTSPSAYEVGIHPSTLDKLVDGDADDLNNTVGPIGPDEVTWAFQWDFDLAPFGSPNSSWQLSKDKQLTVPEPVTLSLLGLGGLAGLRHRRKKGSRR